MGNRIAWNRIKHNYFEPLLERYALLYISFIYTENLLLFLSFHSPYVFSFEQKLKVALCDVCSIAGWDPSLVLKYPAERNGRCSRLSGRVYLPWRDSHQQIPPLHFRFSDEERKQDLSRNICSRQISNILLLAHFLFETPAAIFTS